MAIAPEAPPTQRKRLINGRKMTCPRCKEERDILAFMRMEEIVEYEHETTPIYKCPRKYGGCGWQFAPSEHAVLDSIAPGVPREEITFA